jgi:DNA replication and repair protein RecF
MTSFSTIKITQYKNYSYTQFEFNQRIVGICGLNGKGKTNLLDAIYYLCFAKSYFTKIDGQNVLFGMDGFRIEGRAQAQPAPQAPSISPSGGGNSIELSEEQMVKNNGNVISPTQSSNQSSPFPPPSGEIEGASSQLGEIEGARTSLIAIYKGTGKKDFLLDNVPYEKLSQHIGKFPAVMIAPDDTVLIVGGSEERRKFIDTIISQIDATYLQQLIVYNKVL